MSESRLIGRRSYLNSIQQEVDHCLRGRPRVLLIEGLAGIGKTCFLEEVEVAAEHQGLDVHSGYSDEILTQPYAPFAGLLSRLEAA